MNKLKNIFAITFLLLCVLLTACSGNTSYTTGETPSETGSALGNGTDSSYTPSLQGYRFNEAVSCVEWTYYMECSADGLLRSATGAEKSAQPGESLYNAVILTDYRSYSDTLCGVVENLSCSAEMANRSVETIDESTFTSSDVLAVDFIIKEAGYLYPRLGNVDIKDGHASVELQYDVIVTSMSTWQGVLYFIPIPKGCTSVEVSPVRITDWMSVVPSAEEVQTATTEERDSTTVPTSDGGYSIYHDGASGYAPNLTGYSFNRDIPCILRSYTVEATADGLLRSATGLVKYTRQGEIIYDAYILSDYRSYQDTLLRIAENMPLSLGIEYVSLYEIDESTFAQSDILVIDLIGNRANRLYTRLGSLSVQEGLASVELQYDVQVANTDTWQGALYLIPIPKGSPSVAVTPVRIMDWMSVTP